MVSIIIPRHNEDLTKLLNFINAGVYKNIEIIVVDKGLERSAQRNIGIKKANGKYIMILDADQYPHPQLIKECVNLMMMGFEALYIPEKIITPGLFGKIRNWERQFYTSTPIDCVRFALNPCPLFDEGMTGPEDADWDRRVSNRRATTDHCFYHFDKVGLWSYFRKKAYYAKSMKLFHVKHPNDKVLNWKWRCFSVFLENGKWREFIRKPHYALAVLLIIFIRGFIYAWSKKSKKN